MGSKLHRDRKLILVFLCPRRFSLMNSSRNYTPISVESLSNTPTLWGTPREGNLYPSTPGEEGNGGPIHNWVLSLFDNQEWNVSSPQNAPLLGVQVLYSKTDGGFVPCLLRAPQRFTRPLLESACYPAKYHLFLINRESLPHHTCSPSFLSPTGSWSLLQTFMMLTLL